MELLKNLMEWSQSQTGRMKFNPTYFDLNETIKQIELLLSENARQKSQTITKVLPSNIPVFADKPMINAVLRNLLSNAIKFTNHGGTIKISASLDPEVITVAISDNGIGMSKERIEMLFQIDESYSTQGTENETGTGLGLILCKEFVDKHKGKLWVESAVGKGSTFYFSLPNH
jgi:signal transduction histidine kinase